MQDDEDEKELRDMFRILDKEKKGEVNTNELRYSLNATGADPGDPHQEHTWRPHNISWTAVNYWRQL